MFSGPANSNLEVQRAVVANIFPLLLIIKKKRSCANVIVVVRLFIGTQNRLVALHSALIKTHEETDISPHSVRTDVR
jgi:hypothetical protein